MPTILDGRPVAHQLQQTMLQTLATQPHSLQLGIILVGDNAESLGYITHKRKLARKLGIQVVFEQLPVQSTTDQVIKLVEQFNHDPSIAGFIVQLPMPPQVDESKVLANIDPAKDIDGLSPWSLGKLLEGKPGMVSATARGVIHLLQYYDIPLKGRHAVVMGRSILVGKPIALLLLQQDATVTIVHSKTTDLPVITRQADIVIAAMGQPEMITHRYLKSDAVIIDVGMTYAPDGIKGDVNHNDIQSTVSAISPVPGGVGPLTVTCLFENLLEAYQRQQQRRNNA